MSHHAFAIRTRSSDIEHFTVLDFLSSSSSVSDMAEVFPFICTLGGKRLLLFFQAMRQILIDS
jgi:hypothetical protein